MKVESRERQKRWRGERGGSGWEIQKKRNGEKVDKKSKQRGKMDVGLLNEDGQNG